jgi:hypothetical protein
MKKTKKFYKWFKNLGGNVNLIDWGEINDRLNEPILIVSTFKNRAKEIKEKYNYKFNLIMTSYKTYQEIKIKYPNHLIAYFSEKLQSYVFLGEQGEKVKAVLGTNRINRELSFDIWMTKLLKAGYGVGVLDHLNKIN